MSSVPSASEITADATWLPQALDPKANLVRLVGMSPEGYRAASFLDDRMFQSPVEAHIVPLADVVSAVTQDSRRDAGWIFHIGHVGSTLIARLLGELKGVLSIREPRILRDLTVVPADARGVLADQVTALLSRSFGSDETALVKATSFVSEIAPELVGSDGRALFLAATPRAYIQGILAGENSVKELRMLAERRAQRMAGRVNDLEIDPNNDAHLAAAAWACEITALEVAADAMAGRPVLWGDFDAMLQDIPAALRQLADFFGFPAQNEQLRAIAAGPLMKRYSKAPEYDYSPALRRELLEEAGTLHARSIESALASLSEAAQHSPYLKSALQRTGTEN